MAGAVDPLDAMARFKAAVAQIPNVLAQPAPEVNLLDMNLVGPVISVRPFCHTDDYWQVYFDTNEAIVRLKAAVAKIPNVVAEPAPEVNLLDMNLVGPVIAVRPYCHTDHYCRSISTPTKPSCARRRKLAGRHRRRRRS